MKFYLFSNLLLLSLYKNTFTKALNTHTDTDDEEIDIIVIGAGWSGLGAARLLKDAGENVVVLEARDEIGGRTRTASGGIVNYELGSMWLDGKNDFQPFPFLENPVNRIAEEAGIETVAFAQELDFVYDATTEQELSSLTFNSVGFRFLTQLGILKSQLDETASMEDAADRFIEFNGLSGESARFGKFLIEQAFAETFFAGPADRMSLEFFNENCDFFGFNDDSYVFPNGYNELIRALANGYGDSTEALDIRLSETATLIEYNGESVTVTTTDSTANTTKTYKGSKSIISVPLGVLKSGDIEFSPSLPTWKQDAIDTMQMGFFEKVVLVFEERFWEGSGAMYVSLNDTDIPFFYGFDIIHDPPALYAFYGGNRAIYIQESYSDEEIINKCLEQLSEIYGLDVPDPIETFVSHWMNDPFSYGSYSYISVNATPDDMVTLGEEVENLHFAGEHTNSLFYGQTHGAYMSGRREARKILQQSKTNKGKPRGIFEYIKSSKLFESFGPH